MKLKEMVRSMAEVSFWAKYCSCWIKPISTGTTAA